MLQIPKQNKALSWIVLFFLFILSMPSYAASLQEMYESAALAYNQGEYDQSMSIYQEINKQMPQFAPAYIGIGLCLNAKGADFSEVVYYYKMAVEKDPTSAQTLDQLGRLYYSNGQLDRAQDAFEKALKINPNMPEVDLSLGWINLTGKYVNPEKAILYFKNVIRISPMPNAYFGLGMAYFASNQRAKALDMITQLRTMNQNDLADKLEKAVRENRRVVLEQPNSGQNEEDQKKDDIEKTTENSKGIKVRLRGKLEDLQ